MSGKVSAGIIGGSGLYEMEGLLDIVTRAITTPYGEPSAQFVIGELDGMRVAFLPRHGLPHTIAPHRINYRANLMGMHSLGAERIIAVNATGGIDPAMKPGDIVITDQILDMTYGSRISTFHEEGKIAHIDFTEPYCPEIRAAIVQAAADEGLSVIDRGTYVCVSGPRLESKAEIRHFGQIGGDVIGMTGMPEAALARELEICFANISVVTNYAAGLSHEKLTTTEVVSTMQKSIGKIKRLIRAALPLLPRVRTCRCKDALKDSVM